MSKQQHNTYAYHYMDVSQNTIHYKLSSYLSLMSHIEGKTRFSTINSSGDCNGWSFLFAYYNSTNKSAEFKDLLTYLSTWNGKINTLRYGELPETLKGKYDNGIQVFEQTINDLSWFSQIKTKQVSNYQISQDDRIKQFNYVTDNKHEISKVFDFLKHENTNITSQELPDMLRIAHQWKDAWLDLGVYSSIGGHALSVYLNADGSYTYYDCNAKKGAFTSFSPEEISNMIMKSIGWDTALNDFSLYQLHVKEQPSLTKAVDTSINETLYSYYDQIKSSLASFITPQKEAPYTPAPEQKVAEPLDISFKTASKFVDMAIKSHDLDPIHTILSMENSLSTKLMNKYATKIVNAALNENHSELTKLILEKHYKQVDTHASNNESTGKVLKISDFLSWDVANTFYKLTQGTLGKVETQTVKSSVISLEDCFNCDSSKAINTQSETTYIAPSIAGLQLDDAVHLVANTNIF